MLSEKVRQIRQRLHALHSVGQPLDEVTFLWLLLALVQLEDFALDVEARPAAGEQPTTGSSVIFLSDHVCRPANTGGGAPAHFNNGDDLA